MLIYIASQNEDAMRKFHISFFKKILSSDGHPFKCLQKSVDVEDASADEAIERAKQTFMQDRHAGKDCADTVELEERL